MRKRAEEAPGKPGRDRAGALQSALGQHLRRYRMNKGLSTYQIMGMAHQVVLRAEEGIGGFGPLLQLAAALDVKVTVTLRMGNGGGHAVTLLPATAKAEEGARGDD